MIQDGVEFSRLETVIIDEQQRFGVMQRGEMLSRGKTPHLLMMSASHTEDDIGMPFWRHGYFSHKGKAGRKAKNRDKADRFHKDKGPDAVYDR